MLYTNDLINEFKLCPPKDLFEVINRLFPELTSREVEVIFWLSYGHHTTDIATILEVTAETAKTYVKRCKVKLNVTSTSELRLVFHCRYVSFSLALKLEFSFSPLTNKT